MQKLTLFAAVSGSQVDRESGILRGVSVITEGEAKGHGMIVDAVTLQQVKACAETYVDGLRVKMDHYTGIDAMVGVLRDFAIDGIQLRADLHLIKSHDDFEKIMEMAETMPGSFGLSISFSGECEEVEMPDDDAGKVKPNSGELPPSQGGGVEIVKAARCMEIYSADLVDQPAANPTGLFQAMSEPTAPTEEVPVEAPVQEIPATELAPEILEEISEQMGVPVVEIESVGIESEPSEPETLVKEIKHIAEEVASEKAEETPAEEIPAEQLSAKLSEVVTTFDSQKAEIINLRADLETAHRNLAVLKAEVEKRDLEIAKLDETKRIALRAVGLLPSDVEIEVAQEAAPFDPVASYFAAVEAGDKKLAAELFKAHKSAIFAARRK
jgi:hypothetical protein